jgi:hypothetical protein
MRPAFLMPVPRLRPIHPARTNSSFLQDLTSFFAIGSLKPLPLLVRFLGLKCDVLQMPCETNLSNNTTNKAWVLVTRLTLRH